MDNLNSTLFLESLNIQKGKIISFLTLKISRIEFLYKKEDLTEKDVKRINSEDEHIRTVLSFIDDAENTIKALQAENQHLRVKMTMALNSAEHWKSEYQNSLQSEMNTISTFQKFIEGKVAA